MYNIKTDRARIAKRLIMELGTTLLFEKETGLEKSAASAAKAGFKYIDFDLTGLYDCDIKDEEKNFLSYKKTLESLGLSVRQAHAPYLKFLSHDKKDVENFDLYGKVTAAVRRAAVLGAKYLAYHCYVPYTKGQKEGKECYDYDKVAEENFRFNVDFLYKLKPTLEEYNIKLALENIVAYDYTKRAHAPTVCHYSRECNRFIDELGDENFCVCFDAGHLNLCEGENFAQFTAALGNRIEILHLHDNFGIQNDWFGELDRHLPPFVGSLKWDKLCEALKNINFNGVYSFECSSYGLPVFLDREYEYIYDCANIIFGNQSEKINK